MKLLADPSQSSSPLVWAGLETPIWTIIIGIVAVLASIISIGVAIYTLKAADRREHHRWLQEKRREAYVTFMTSARRAYDAISERGQYVEAPRVESDYEGPAAPDLAIADRQKLAEAMADIDRNMGEVLRAQDVLAIVGPQVMEKLGLRVIARLKLDRGYYSPTGWSDRNKPQERESILRNAEATENEDFLNALNNAYATGPVDVELFLKAFHDNRLDGFWVAFNLEARRVLMESKPGRHR